MKVPKIIDGLIFRINWETIKKIWKWYKNRSKPKPKLPKDKGDPWRAQPNEDYE